MLASANLGSVLIGISDQSGVIAALVTGVCLIVAQIISSMSESRRHKRELRYRNAGRGGSGLNAGLLLGTLLSVGVLIYFAQRKDDKGTPIVRSDPPTSLVADTRPATTATPATNAAPVITAAAAATAASAKVGCAAFTVQIAAIKDGAAGMAEFQSQAQQLAKLLPTLGELHSADGDACGAVGRTQFYFGPFSGADATRDACFSIGQVLHDNSTQFTTFQSQGAIVYPYFRIEPGVSVRGSDGETLLCSPGNS